MSVRTIPEAAAELRVSSRALQKIVVENGLYIAVSNRKRITHKHAAPVGKSPGGSFLSRPAARAQSAAATIA